MVTGDPCRIRDRLRWMAESRGSDVFVSSLSETDVRIELTYSEVNALVGRTASMLSGHGVLAGQAVNLNLGNTWHYVVALFACAEIGAIAVPTNPSATLDDLTFIASQSRCVASVTTSESAETVLAAAEMAPDLRQVFVVGHVVPGTLSFDDEMIGVTAEPLRSTSSASDVVAVLYTSGTTGWPKGSLITNANLCYAGECVASLLRIRPDDRWLITLPLFHMNALGYSLMSALMSGASVTLCEDVELADYGQFLERSRATLASLFSAHIRRILMDAADEPVNTRLRNLIFAQSISGYDRSRFEQRFGTEMLQVYGLTETLAPTIADQFGGPYDNESIGVATLWSSVRLVDETGRHVVQGEVGELEVRGIPGHSLAKGYLGDNLRSSRSESEIWFRTGDRMLEDERGRYRFLGRREKLLKPLVENVSTAEVERVLLEHVSVDDVAVLGVLDSEGAEQIVAFVVLRPGDDDASEEELLEFGRDRLGEVKTPSRVVVVDGLPRSPVGKIRNFDLRAIYADRVHAE